MRLCGREAFPPGRQGKGTGAKKTEIATREISSSEGESQFSVPALRVKNEAGFRRFFFSKKNAVAIFFSSSVLRGGCQIRVRAEMFDKNAMPFKLGDGFANVGRVPRTDEINEEKVFPRAFPRRAGLDAY